jgi:hypothetical protein
VSELRLNWEELHHLNPNLKGKVYQTGITRVADEASDVNLKARWMKIGDPSLQFKCNTLTTRPKRP